jgi:pimeloyl-ACP methyl ester carboxylesterase
VDLLKSVDLLTTDTADAIYNRHKIADARNWVRHDVDVYRITYATRDTHGTEIVASGAILVPKGVERPRTLCYCRGTIIPGSGERNAPSYYQLERIKDSYDDHYEMSCLAATFAAAGYLVVAPDGIGYGASKGREHPYVHAPSLGWTSLDMLRAAREFAGQKTLEMDKRVFVAGWSEGGLCGSALHKMIEETCRDEFSVGASSLLAGCYALTTMMDLFCHYDEAFPEAGIYYWMLRSMIRVHGLKRPFDRTIVPPHAEALAKDVLAPVPENPRQALDPEFRRRFLDGTETEMRDAVKDSDRYDWKPLAPVFLHHGTHDDIVPFFTSQMAYEAMRAKGVRVTLYPYLGRDHYQPANAYIIRSLGDFAET